MDPEDLDPVAFDAAMCAATVFLRHHDLEVDPEARHSIVSGILSAFIAAGGVCEENVERW